MLKLYLYLVTDRYIHYLSNFVIDILPTPKGGGF